MCHQFYLYCAHGLITRFFKLKRLQWHLKNIWDEKYSRWIISFISIISNKLIINRLQLVHGKIFKVLDDCQNKCVINDHLDYIKRINNKSYFFISILLKLFPITVTYSFVEFLAITFPWQAWALVVSTRNRDFCATTESSGYSKIIDFSYPRMTFPCCLNPHRVFLSWFTKGADQNADEQPVMKWFSFVPRYSRLQCGVEWKGRGDAGTSLSPLVLFEAIKENEW